MASKPHDYAEALAAPMYALAAYLIAMPAVDYAQSIGAPQLGSAQWRFASIGLLSSVLTTPVLGIALAVVIAATREHHAAQRVFAWLTLGTAAMLLMLTVLFALDALQLRGGVPDEARANMERASLRAVLKYLGTVALLAWLGFKSLGISARRAAKPEGRAPVPLITK